MRYRTADFERAQVGSAAGKVVIDSGQPNACVHRGRPRTKLEIEIAGFVQRARIGAGRRRLLEHVVIHKHAMAILAGGLAKLLERLESTGLARLRFEASLRLRGQFAGLAREIGARRERRRAPLEGKLRALV